MKCTFSQAVNSINMDRWFNVPGCLNNRPQSWEVIQHKNKQGLEDQKYQAINVEVYTFNHHCKSPIKGPSSSHFKGIAILHGNCHIQWYQQWWSPHVRKSGIKQCAIHCGSGPINSLDHAIHRFGQQETLWEWTVRRSRWLELLLSACCWINPYIFNYKWFMVR